MGVILRLPLSPRFDLSLTSAASSLPFFVVKLEPCNSQPSVYPYVIKSLPRTYVPGGRKYGSDHSGSVFSRGSGVETNGAYCSAQLMENELVKSVRVIFPPFTHLQKKPQGEKDR